MHVFVTGASGFIGAQLVRALASRGDKVHVLCRVTADVSELPSDGVEIFQGDILDKESIAQAMMGCEQVFHVAGYARNWAKDPAIFDRINVEGTKNILETALRCGSKKAVVTSTSVTFGPSAGKETTESAQRQVPCFTEYEASKLRAEQATELFVRRGLEVVTVNPTRVFGPGAMTEGNSLTKMIELYLRGKWRIILGDGTGIGNYAYVEDIVSGHLLAMSNGKSGERYVLGGENLSYNAFFDIVSDVSKKSYRMIHMPSSLALGYSYLEQSRAAWFNSYPQITPSWVKTFLADWAFSSEKARLDLGYQVTPIRTALSNTVGWLKKTSPN